MPPVIRAEAEHIVGGICPPVIGIKWSTISGGGMLTRCGVRPSDVLCKTML